MKIIEQEIESWTDLIIFIYGISSGHLAKNKENKWSGLCVRQFFTGERISEWFRFIYYKVLALDWENFCEEEDNKFNLTNTWVPNLCQKEAWENANMN